MESVLKLAIQAEVSGLDQIQQSIRQLESSKISIGLDSSVVRELQAATSDIEKLYSDTIAKAIKSGAERADLRKLEEALQPSMQKWQAAARAAAAELQKMRDAATANERAAAAENYTKQLAIIEKQRKVFREHHSKYGAIVEKQKRVLGDTVRSLDKVAGKFERVANSISGMARSAMSGDAGGVMSSAGSGLRGASKSLDKTSQLAKARAKAQKAGAKGTPGAANAGRAAAAMGRMAAAAGTAAAALGAVVGVLGVFVAIAAAVDKQTTDLNKTILQGVSAFDLIGSAGAGSGRKLKSVLNDLREAATDMSNNMRWMTDAKEQLEIINAYSQAGFTIKEMIQGIETSAERQKQFHHVTKQALVTATLLGSTTKEVATAQAAYLEDLGGTLDQIADKFRYIAKQASRSGMGVKRFYSMILQATSGMSIYNVRLEEAANLLVTLGRILGSKLASQLMGGLTKGFADMSYTERFKRLLTTGKKKRTSIFKKAANQQAGGLLDIYADKGLKGADAKFNRQFLTNALANVGVGAKSRRSIESGDSKVLVRELKNLTNDEVERLLGEIKNKDTRNNGANARRLEALIDLARGTSGKLGDQAKAMGKLTMGGKLAMDMNAFAGVIGKPLHRMEAIELAGFEAATNISGQQLEYLINISRNTHASWKYAKSQEKTMKNLLENRGSNKAMGEEFDKRNLQFAEGSGMAMSTRGKTKGQWVHATVDTDADGKKTINYSDKVIKDVDDLIMNAIGDGSGLRNAKAADIKLAEDVRANTNETAKILKMGIQAILQNIYNLVQRFFSWATGPTKAEKKEYKEAVDTATTQEQVAYKRILDIQDQIDKKQNAIRDGEVKEEDKKFVEKEIAILKEKQMEAKKSRGVWAAIRDQLPTAWEKMQDDGKVGGFGKNLKAMVGMDPTDPNFQDKFIKEADKAAKKLGVFKSVAFESGYVDHLHKQAVKTEKEAKQYIADNTGEGKAKVSDANPMTGLERSIAIERLRNERKRGVEGVSDPKVGEAFGLTQTRGGKMNQPGTGKNSIPTFTSDEEARKYYNENPGFIKEMGFKAGTEDAFVDLYGPSGSKKRTGAIQGGAAGGVNTLGAYNDALKNKSAGRHTSYTTTEGKRVLVNDEYIEKAIELGAPEHIARMLKDPNVLQMFLSHANFEGYSNKLTGGGKAKTIHSGAGGQDSTSFPVASGYEEYDTTKTGSLPDGTKVRLQGKGTKGKSLKWGRKLTATTGGAGLVPFKAQDPEYQKLMVATYGKDAERKHKTFTAQDILKVTELAYRNLVGGGADEAGGFSHADITKMVEKGRGESVAKLKAQVEDPDFKKNLVAGNLSDLGFGGNVIEEQKTAKVHVPLFTPGAGADEVSDYKKFFESVPVDKIIQGQLNQLKYERAQRKDGLTPEDTARYNFYKKLADPDDPIYGKMTDDQKREAMLNSFYGQGKDNTGLDKRFSNYATSTLGLKGTKTGIPQSVIDQDQSVDPYVNAYGASLVGNYLTHANPYQTVGYDSTKKNRENIPAITSDHAYYAQHPALLDPNWSGDYSNMPQGFSRIDSLDHILMAQLLGATTHAQGLPEQGVAPTHLGRGKFSGVGTAAAFKGVPTGSNIVTDAQNPRTGEYVRLGGGDGVERVPGTALKGPGLGEGSNLDVLQTEVPVNPKVYPNDLPQHLQTLSKTDSSPEIKEAFEKLSKGEATDEDQKKILEALRKEHKWSEQEAKKKAEALAKFNQRNKTEAAKNTEKIAKSQKETKEAVEESSKDSRFKEIVRQLQEVGGGNIDPVKVFNALESGISNSSLKAARAKAKESDSTKHFFKRRKSGDDILLQTHAQDRMIQMDDGSIAAMKFAGGQYTGTIADVLRNIMAGRDSNKGKYKRGGGGGGPVFNIARLELPRVKDAKTLAEELIAVSNARKSQFGVS